MLARLAQLVLVEIRVVPTLQPLASEEVLVQLSNLPRRRMEMDFGLSLKQGKCSGVVIRSCACFMNGVTKNGV
jgi:hypothetical protein